MNKNEQLDVLKLLSEQAPILDEGFSDKVIQRTQLEKRVLSNRLNKFRLRVTSIAAALGLTMFGLGLHFSAIETLQVELIAIIGASFMGAFVWLMTTD